jgi:hypothetical protein
VALEVRALEDDLLVPVEAKPLEPFEDRAGRVVGGARLVGVLDAEEELPAGARARSQLKSAVRAPPTWR